MRQEIGSDPDGLTAQPAATGALELFFFLFGHGVFWDDGNCTLPCLKAAKKELCGTTLGASIASPLDGAHRLRKNEEEPRRPFRRRPMRSLV